MYGKELRDAAAHGRWKVHDMDCRMDTSERTEEIFGICACTVMCMLVCVPAVSADKRMPYVIVDTAQIRCYDDNKEIEYPEAGMDFYGQDAQYAGNQPSYKKNGDGTVTDLVTGLMWQSDPGEKMTLTEAITGAAECTIGGHTDWRLPTIKEMYSLIQFTGTDPDPMSRGSSGQKPFIDTTYFKFQYGNTDRGERIIDSQFATTTKYVSTTMRGDETMFGVNFADGRIKGYGVKSPRDGRKKRFYVLYVRENEDYGKNIFKDNNDGTVTDLATGLMWTKSDKNDLNWQQALEWAETLELAGHSDWRLPNVKELQSIVDYTRSPATTNSAAIDPVFEVTSFVAESGKKDFPWYWSSTTHAGVTRAGTASYVAFGTSFGWMQNRWNGEYTLMDVHGAGSQRSDPKSGDPSRYPHGRGPQGDVIRIYNAVRCVRGGTAEPRATGPAVKMTDIPDRRRRMDGRGRGRPPIGRPGMRRPPMRGPRRFPGQRLRGRN